MSETFDRDRLRKELEGDEGRRRMPYKDSQGHLTIGIGWNLDANGLPDRIIDELLDEGIDRAKADLDVLEPQWRELDPDRQRAMLNLAFNLGRNVFSGFHRFLACINEWLNGGDVDALDRAALELSNSHAAQQAPKRYARLAARIRANRA